MELKDKVVVITGGANGIGKALAIRFKAAGAKHIVVADLDEAGASAVAHEVGGTAERIDVSKEADIQRVIDTTENAIGPIDLFCSNAGIAKADSLDSPNDEWQLIWDVNVMSHMYAAR
ncbi:MAG: NAD(P)-dependent dehydrogenase (short-subunit alcohol dehydrogenase family), partial [Gammaproteobacteria bacterium]